MALTQKQIEWAKSHDWFLYDTDGSAVVHEVSVWASELHVTEDGWRGAWARAADYVAEHRSTGGYGNTCVRDGRIITELDMKFDNYTALREWAGY
jgi:hypothetical protein